jgi:hypothetical protein
MDFEKGIVSMPVNHLAAAARVTILFSAAGN